MEMMKDLIAVASLPFPAFADENYERLKTVESEETEFGCVTRSCCTEKGVLGLKWWKAEEKEEPEEFEIWGGEVNRQSVEGFSVSWRSTDSRFYFYYNLYSFVEDDILSHLLVGSRELIVEFDPFQGLRSSLNIGYKKRFEGEIFKKFPEMFQAAQQEENSKLFLAKEVAERFDRAEAISFLAQTGERLEFRTLELAVHPDFVWFHRNSGAREMRTYELDDQLGRWVGSIERLNGEDRLECQAILAPKTVGFSASRRRRPRKFLHETPLGLKENSWLKEIELEDQWGDIALSLYPELETEDVDFAVLQAKASERLRNDFGLSQRDIQLLVDETRQVSEFLGPQINNLRMTTAKHGEGAKQAYDLWLLKYGYLFKE